MIEKMNTHYSMTNPESIYDEEALTALELAGRTASKVNEIVDSQNELISNTETTLNNQNTRLDNMETTQIPNMVEQSVKDHLESGDFDVQIDDYAGHIKDKIETVDNKKIDKGGVGQVTMANLSQEVKTAMTGGSVAVVGENSIMTTNLTKDCVTPDNLLNIRASRQCLDLSTLEQNMYWWNPDYKESVNSASIFQPFKIFAGQTYYFQNVYVYHSWIKWADGTSQRVGEVTAPAYSGEIHAAQDGVCYVTVAPDYEEKARVQNYPCGYGGNVQRGYTALMLENQILSLRDYKKLARKIPYQSVTVYEGAMVDGNTIIIPTGYSGYQSYPSFRIGGEYAGKNVTFILNYKVKNGATNFDESFDMKINSVKGGASLPVNYEMVTEEEDGSITYVANVDIPSSFTYMTQVYMQIFNKNLVNGNVEITFNETLFMSDGMIESLHINEEDVDIYTTTTVTIDKNGVGDYTSFRECFSDIEPTARNRYIVEIKKGVYELSEEYTSEEWNATGFIGLFVPDWCTLVGVGNREDVVIQATFNTKTKHGSTLNFGNTCGIENLTVIGNKTRYAIHDDFASEDNNEYVRTVKNCVIISNENYYERCYGAGTRQGAKWFFENTHFISTSNSGASFSCHNNVNFTRGCELHFKNCRFQTGGTVGASFGSLNNNANGVLTYVTFEGCKFDTNGVGVRLREESAELYGAGILFKVSGYANKNANYDIVNTDGKDYSGYIDLI